MSKHITLCPKKHSKDKYTCEKIELWLNTLLGSDFLGKDIIFKQLNGAEYEIEGEYDYIFVRFKPNDSAKYPYNVRVPVQIYTRQPNLNIVHILLHIIDGYVNILEIYNMNGVNFTGEFSLDNIEETIIDEKVQLK